jgi:hypothetical protein
VNRTGAARRLRPPRLVRKPRLYVGLFLWPFLLLPSDTRLSGASRDRSRRNGTESAAGGGCGSKHEIHHFRPVLVGHLCIGHLLYTARGWSALDRADQLVARSLILTLQLSSCRLSQARLPPDMARHDSAGVAGASSGPGPLHRQPSEQTPLHGLRRAAGCSIAAPCGCSATIH